MTSKEQLLANVLHWVNVLEGKHEPEDGDGIGLEYDSLEYVCESSLDVEYTVSGGGWLIGASYLMAFGGPTVRIDTRHSTVIGTWGHDRCERPYTDKIGLKSHGESFAEAVGLNVS
jgi:hypothetical protein